MSFWADEDGIEMSGHLRMELKCDEKIVVEGKRYDCYVISVKGSGDFDTGIGPEGTWENSGEQYSDKSEGRAVKSESLMDMTMTYLGETIKMTTETTSERLSWSTNWTSEKDPEIGDCWKETEKKRTTTENTADTPDGIETSSDTETETRVTYYEYVGDENVNSNLGNIECKVIQSYDESDIDSKDENYVVGYMDKKLNLPVKSETYEDGESVITMDLVAYKIGSDKAGTEVIGPIGGTEEDRGLFGLGKIAGIDISLIVMIAILVVVALLIVVFMMKGMMKGHKEPEAPVKSKFPVQQTPVSQQPPQPQYQPPPQQPPQQPPPPPQPVQLQPSPPPQPFQLQPFPPPQPVQRQVTTYNCPRCGKPFTAQPTGQAQLVSCPSCSGQVTISPLQQPQPQYPAQGPPAQQPPQQPPPPSLQQPFQQPQQPSQESQPQPQPPTPFQSVQPSNQGEMEGEGPLDILKKRLARGEIDLETYRELKKELE